MLEGLRERTESRFDVILWSKTLMMIQVFLLSLAEEKMLVFVLAHQDRPGVWREEGFMSNRDSFRPPRRPGFFTSIENSSFAFNYQSSSSQKSSSWRQVK